MKHCQIIVNITLCIKASTIVHNQCKTEGCFESNTFCNHASDSSKLRCEPCLDIGILESCENLGLSDEGKQACIRECGGIYDQFIKVVINHVIKQ